ncbi:MAG: dihydropteroate synthase [Pseudomonadota bacterium]
MTGDLERPYFRPVPCDRSYPGAFSLGGGLFGFREIEILSRSEPPRLVPAEAAPALFPDQLDGLERFTRTRASFSGIGFERPRVMGIVNVTPDSFSDGGQFSTLEQAVDHGLSLAAAGADVLDIGGESTRPGALPVDAETEADRVLPVITGLQEAGCAVPISIDTRNASVARRALAAGARIFNDVSALQHDPASLDTARDATGVCLMHAQGDPQTMQDDPQYENVLLDVYDFLEYRISACEMAGIPRQRLLVDPGIGFGKALEHNLDLLRRLSLFHGLGCGMLLGVSRKGFIRRLSGEKEAARRVPGSIAAALAGLEEGVQMLRVHDVKEMKQALDVWTAIKLDQTEMEA